MKGRGIVSRSAVAVFAGGELIAAVAIPARILYLLHPSLRALVLRLHTQLHAFVNFVLSLDQPIAHAPNPAGMGVPPERDSRATVLAKENVRDVLGKEGVDLLEWGKAIQDLGPGPRESSPKPVPVA